MEIPSHVLLKEKVGYLKSALALLNGTLYLTEDSLVLIAHKTTVASGLLGRWLKQKVEAKKYGFRLAFSAIASVKRGSQGLQNNVLVITNTNQQEYRIIVKDYDRWEEAIYEKMMS